MRILLADLESEWRGGQNQALLLLKGLRARGHEPLLLARRESALAQRAQQSSIRVHAVRGPAVQFRAALVLRRLLARQEYDLLHANESHALTAAWLARAPQRLPIVASRRVAYLLTRGRLARARYRAAQRIIAVSEFVARTVVESGLPAEVVSVVRDGVETPPLATPEARQQVRQRWGVAEDEPLLGCVGYLLPEKGQHLLIRALPEVRAHFPKVRLLLAGTGRTRRQLERLARELGIEAAVHFAGFVEEVAQVYAALDVFVFPSLAEPLGSALLGAMAQGLPVVAAASGGVLEIIENERNGLLFAPGDPNGIAAGVVQLLGDASLAQGLGQAARRTVLERFHTEQMVENTLRIYELVCAGPRAK